MADNQELRKLDVDLLHRLPDEVCMNIFLQLSTPDLLRCMCLCRRFKTLLSTQQFWKKYLQISRNFTTVNLNEEKLNSPEYINLDLLKRDWFCFWDDSNEPVAADDPSRYIFRPFVQVWDYWDNKIITPGNFDPFSENVDYYALNKALYLLSQLLQKCDEFEITATPYYSSKDSVVDVCLFSFQGNKLPTIKDVLEIFHVHKDIIKGSGKCKEVYLSEELNYILEIPADEDDDETYIKITHSLNNTFSWLNKNQEHAEDLYTWLQKLFQPSLMFYAGKDLFHPQVYFHLTTLSTGWVGGVFTTIALI